MKNIDMTAGFETLDLDSLVRVNGGDGWSDYKDKFKQNVSDTYTRAKDAVNDYGSAASNASKGQWGAAANDLGSGIDNHAGYVYNLVKTASDLVPEIPFFGRGKK